MLKKLLFILCIAVTLSAKTQVQLSVYSEISIITCGSGDNLYEAFGHSAIRLKDPVLQWDFVYNYGQFDFNAPNFYLNFVKGKMQYKLARYSNFKQFLDSYKHEKRWVKQQVLNLTQQEKQAFFLFLERNAQPLNANYLYDPFFDNCASKLKDITKTILKDKVHFKDENIVKNLSFRTLMNDRIHWNTWGSFGINLALGSKLDTKRQPIEYTYLPDYIYEIFKHSTIKTDKGEQPLIEKEVVLANYPKRAIKSSFFGPFTIFLLLLVFVIYKTYKDVKSKKINTTFDGLLLLITGLIGCLLLFLWFFTTHSTTPNNFNLLWAFAPNLVVGFLLFKKEKPKWLHFYFKLLLLLLVAVVILWVFNIQALTLAFVPLLLSLAVRYFYLQKSLHNSC